MLFWCSVGASLLLAVAAVYRRSVWEGFRDRNKTFIDLDDADGVVGGAALLSVGLTVASVIVLCIWSLRTARNARTTGATDVSPGLACGGWYIPFANLIVPFIQLRRIALHRRQSTSGVSLWQGLLIGAGVLSIATRSVGDVQPEDSVDDVINRLSAQSVLAFVSALVLAAVTLAATRAMRDVDGAAAART